MLTRARAHLARPPSPDSLLSSASQLPDPPRATPAAAVASSSSDEYYSPPTSPPPARRRGRGRPPSSLGPSERRAPSAAPANGGVAHRIRWTSDLNESVMRAYFRATDGGTNLTACRSRILSTFQALHPTLTITEQRLSARVRDIQRRQLLSSVVLERLRHESQLVHIDFDMQDPVANTTMLPPSNNCLSPSECAQVSVTTQENEQLRSTLEATIFEFRSSLIPNLPRLPRLPTHRRSLALMGALNNLLSHYINDSNNINDTHSILYCGAIAACRALGIRFPAKPHTGCPRNIIPQWQYRIEQRIVRARTLIAKLYCFQRGNTRPRVMRFVKQAFIGTNISPQNYSAWITERIDFWKQKVGVWANRIRRYRERAQRYQINRTFQSDAKRVYRDWERSHQLDDGQPPTHDAAADFWRNIWSAPVNHSESAWFDVVKRACESITMMEPIIFTKDEISSAISLAPNWKSPGPDGLHNFWIKWFPCSHERLATQFQEALETGSLPNFMTTGVTHLLHKSGCASEPKNYRPITCLPTLYKLLTSILKTKIYKHVSDNNILAPTQNGCKSRSRGTKELLLIDMTICQQVRRNRKNVCMAWIDYKKAYDSVPHSWLRKILELYKIHPTIINLLSSCMDNWATVLRHPGTADCSGSPDLIRIKRGIFQGDSLSPLWFCLALNPLSTVLEASKLGYRMRRGAEAVSHLLYMDDLKLYAPKKSDLVELLKITLDFSSSIRMEFGADKCAIIHVQSGNIVNSDNLQLTENISLRSLSASETYRYLGMPQTLGIDDGAVKQSLRDRFLDRLTKVLNSLLSGGNKTRAFNGWVMPVLSYSFGILRWTQTELDALDRRVRCLLTTHRMHHPRSSTMRLYIPRKCGGRGYLSAKDLHNREVCSLREHFLSVDAGLHRGVVMVDKGLTPLSLANENWRKPRVLSISERKDIWKGKELHGRFYRALMGPEVDQTASVAWLRFSNLFGETEGFVCAIMDEVIKTRNYRRHILKDGTVDICRACHCPGESIRHIISGCSRLANSEYLHRHNLVAKIIHQQLALKYLLVDSDLPYYQYSPQPVLDNGHITLYWDRSIITDRSIIANRPDIVLIDRLMRRAMIIDVTIPHDSNLVKAEQDKIAKYLDLSHEVARLWGMDTVIIVPVVISVHGLIAKSFNLHLEKLSLKSWVRDLAQKAVVLDTARIVRRFLTLEP